MSLKVTKRSEDYSQWYTDVILKAEVADYSPVKGCMVIRPTGYAIWENIQKILDKMIKDTGHQNAYFPLFIPESFLHKEAKHVEGFSPECAVVTHGGGKKLEEPLVVRPTSETIMYAMYSKWIQSYRDLPLLINQWANIVRWEMRTRLFLRTTEFLWQEGHTAHATLKEAEEEVLKMLNVYKEFVQNYMAIPVIAGKKSESERFAGAMETYTIEGMMQDKKALQAGTSHLLGQNFAKAFDVKFQDENGNWQYVWQTSWGVSTRLIGALIMVHGDDQGLVIPPRIAPLQIVIVPIWQKIEEKIKVLESANRLFNILKDSFTVKIDDRDQYKPGWKFNDWEQKGVPLRIEIGPKDIEKEQVILARRDGLPKTCVKIEKIKESITEILDSIQKNLFDRALKFREENTFTITEYSEFKKLFEGEGGFVKTFWCGSSKCEEVIKEETKATIRCIPLDIKEEKGKCIYCKEESKFNVIMAQSY